MIHIGAHVAEDDAGQRTCQRLADLEHLDPLSGTGSSAETDAATEILVAQREFLAGEIIGLLACTDRRSRAPDAQPA